MAEQLDHLDTMFRQPNVDIRVLAHDGNSLFARGRFELIAKQGRTQPFLSMTPPAHTCTEIAALVAGAKVGEFDSLT